MKVVRSTQERGEQYNEPHVLIPVIEQSLTFGSIIFFPFYLPSFPPLPHGLFFFLSQFLSSGHVAPNSFRTYL